VIKEYSHGGDKTDFRSPSRCGELSLEVQTCTRCSCRIHPDEGRCVLVEQRRGEHVPVWLCRRCYAETERLKPYLKTWMPMAVVILVFGVGILMIEFIAVGIARLLTNLF
jgi:hypothetical protein